MIELKEGKIIEFECELISPFHSTFREHRNLLRCAPYILGSTFRGSLAKYFIQQNCSEEKIEKLKRMEDIKNIRQFHLICKGKCPVKYFFTNQTQLLFSFGNFAEPNYIFPTRISLNRNDRSATEGVLVNLEAIATNTKFKFQIILLEDALEIENEVKRAVEYIGLYVGIGRFKSIGFGRFKVNAIKEYTLNNFFKQVSKNYNFKEGIEKIKLKLKTPLVLDFYSKPSDLKLLGKIFSEMLYTRTIELSREIYKESIEKHEIKRVIAQIKTEFVSRFSLETNTRENRLVAWVDSAFQLETSEITDNFKFQLLLCSMFGIGEWSDWGFGRFDIVMRENNGK
ncbi:MAG TPA: hypothetical protein EYP22_05085 [Methanosarcinales archaeon]|nr:hypothetical protein [Methanosarcinales archaeon]